MQMLMNFRPDFLRLGANDLLSGVHAGGSFVGVSVRLLSRHRTGGPDRAWQLAIAIADDHHPEPAAAVFELNINQQNGS